MPLPIETPKLKRAPAREEIRSKLESWIVEGTLHPEEVLNDKQIAEAFGVSRMPVREALRSLEDTGFVETSWNRWTRVAPLRVDDARHLYALLATLEDLALRTAFSNFTTDDLATLRGANAELARALTNQDAIAASRADCAFHLVWVRRAGNPQLGRAAHECRMKLMRIEIAYFGSAEDLRKSVEEHIRIVKGLKAKDLDRALEALRRHWQESVRRCFARGVVSRGASKRGIEGAV